MTCHLTLKQLFMKRRNPKRKGNLMQDFDTKRFMKNLGDSYNVHSIKQVPMHPTDRLATTTENALRVDEVKFLKQVPANLRDKLLRKTNTVGEKR